MFEAGSGSNATMAENEQAFRDVMFRPRAAVFTPQRDLRTTVLGHEISTINLREALSFAPQALSKPRWLADYLRRGPIEPKVAMGLNPDGTPMGPFDGIGKIYQRTPAWEDIP
jgi:hypothetical protein